jgi:hypothetical protein
VGNGVGHPLPEIMCAHEPQRTRGRSHAGCEVNAGFQARIRFLETAAEGNLERRTSCWRAVYARFL